MTTHADVATMASILATTDGLHLADETACILALHQARFAAADIAIWLDEARELAVDIRATMIDDAAEEATS